MCFGGSAPAAATTAVAPPPAPPTVMSSAANSAGAAAATGTGAGALNQALDQNSPDVNSKKRNVNLARVGQQYRTSDASSNLNIGAAAPDQSRSGGLGI